jgi:hypothetical protein
MPTTADLGSSHVLSYLRDLCAEMVVYSDIINRYQKELKIRKILLYSQCAEVKREAAKFNWEAQKTPYFGKRIILRFFREKTVTIEKSRRSKKRRVSRKSGYPGILACPHAGSKMPFLEISLS